MVQIIAVAGQKGGAGKTTIATNLATAWAATGRRVLLVDADPQGSARIWADIAAELERDVVVPVLATGGPSMADNIRAVAESTDVLIIDTPPRLAIESRTAMMLAHLVLVPVSPGAQDVWALGQTADTLAEVQTVRPELVARVVLNRLDRRTAFASSLGEDANTSGIKILTAALGNRIGYAEAFSDGSGAVVAAPASPAAVEVRALLAEVDGLLP